jgi:DNA topoisomerase-1
MSKILVIVESPTKAKTISKFLGKGFNVESSFGHVRDLPKSTMGIDIEGGTFEPDYEIPPTKKKKVAELKKLAKNSDEILFATDEDREGEAISWHLAQLLKIKESKVKRLVFHEITKNAIEKALENPRGLNTDLVNAQQARRVLDRLVGYELSPLLWKKVRYGLSAGRVQSVAVHLIVIRENERAKFKVSSYFDLLAELKYKKDVFTAKLIKYNDKPIPTGKDFDENTGKLKDPDNFTFLDEKQAKNLSEKLLETKPWEVSEITENPYQTHPYPPFITSTMQQEASRKLGWGAKHTMRTAQSLYENGYITYMRTDSVNLSDQAIHAARDAAEEFGKEYVADAPKKFDSKSKLTQEAHEAIRPAGSTFQHPSDVEKQVDRDEAKLYDLIWKRTVASQMKSALMSTIIAKINVEKAVFEAKGKKIEFAGYLRAYVEGSDDPEAELEDQEIHLPDLKEKQELDVKSLNAEGHETKPPARYTEASLIKKLESEDVGRPSTYATILDTIIERDYVLKQNNSLVPTYTAMIVDYYLHKYFNKLVDVKFTSKMENDLDKIAHGKEEWKPYIKEFYEDKKDGFHMKVEKASESDEYPNIILGKDPESNNDLIIKSGKYGPYIQRGEGGEGNTASLTDSIAPADLKIEEAVELLNKPQGPEVITTDEETGKEITKRTGRYGPYLQLGEDEDPSTSSGRAKKAKKSALTYGPKHIPISSSIDIENLTEDQAKKIISFPLDIGESSGEKITASVGRFGPYLKKGDDFRSIPKDKDILTITLREAEEIFAQEKKGRGRRAKKVLKELGKEPKTGEPVQVLDGPYGPYISNGTRTFAPVPEGVKPEDVTLEQALKLIEEKKNKKAKKKKR